MIFWSDNSEKKVNLIPLELRPSIANFHNISRIFIFSFVLIPILGSGVKFVKMKTSAELNDLIKKRDHLSREIQNHIRLKESGTGYKTIQAIQTAISEKVYWANIFKELSTLFPKSVWLTNFEAKIEQDGKKVVIAGSSTSQSDIADLFSRLENSYYFRDLKIKYSEVSEEQYPKVFQFQFEGNIFDVKNNGEDNG